MKFTVAGNKFILLPTITIGDYKILGYNWLSIETGDWNSCGFETKEAAISAYKNHGIREVKISISDKIVVWPDKLFEI